jgi:hypothetical protein
MEMFVFNVGEKIMPEKKPKSSFPSFHVTLTPLTIILLILGIIFSIGGIIVAISNIFLFASVVLLTAFVYRVGEISIKTIIVVGIMAGLIAWIINLIVLLSGASWWIGLPLVGAFFAGTLAVASIILFLIADISAGVILSGVIGGLIYLYNRMRK